MDLVDVESYLRPQDLSDLAAWQADWAWLAGGTWLFSEPQPQIRTLVDLNHLGWSELEITPEGLAIGATCVMARLVKEVFPASWTSMEALRSAVYELASFKVQAVATVAGNLCLALPAGTFAPVMLVLGAQYQLISMDGSSRWVEAHQFQIGDRKTLLQPGEVMRRIWMPEARLKQSVNYQRLCMAASGLAVATVVTAYDPVTAKVRFGISGSLAKPILIEVELLPCESELKDLLDAAVPPGTYLSDITAGATYRYHMTQVLMKRGLQQICK